MLVERRRQPRQRIRRDLAGHAGAHHPSADHFLKLRGIALVRGGADAERQAVAEGKHHRIARQRLQPGALAAGAQKQKKDSPAQALHFGAHATLSAGRASGGGEGMKPRIKAPKDFWAGLMFIGFGGFFMIWALSHYQMGSAVRMGPAYFPAVLGGLLVFLGILVLIESFAMAGPPVPRFMFRPLILISAGCVLYGYLMKPLGLVLATGVLVFISALGGHEFKWKEVTILYVVLVVFSLLVFVKGLTLPFPLWPDAYS